MRDHASFRTGQVVAREIGVMEKQNILAIATEDRVI